MADFQTATDRVKKEPLQSSIQAVHWSCSVAAPGETASLRSFLNFVGNESSIEIEVVDRKGKKHLKHEGRTRGSLYIIQFDIPEDAKEALQAKVSLPKHGLKDQSSILTLLPALRVTNAKWDREIVRRGDVVGLSADVEGAQEGTDASVDILEHDQDGAHDPITTIRTTVKEGKINLQWSFEYIDDTDDIPTDDECEQGYNPPEYFFRARVRGAQADSGLLQFKDWVDVALNLPDGRPISDRSFTIHLPDGSKRTVRSDSRGSTRLEDIPPGKIRIELPEDDMLFRPREHLEDLGEEG